MAKVLVTGGAGYIGSHALRVLDEHGYEPVCFDNLSTGHRRLAGDYPFVQGDLADSRVVDHAFSDHAVEAVVHFASLALVEESCRDPGRYYHDNILNALNLLEGMCRHGVSLIVFSSSCAVYGVPSRVPIDETNRLDPVNPYGVTKMVIERMLADYGRARGIRSVSLRYFNAAGAAPDGATGELHDPETHLIPRLLDIAADGGRSAEIYGNDYPTPDGTCIRDYIHVLDLAGAHAAAIDYLLNAGPTEAFNLGTGRGHSVLEVMRQVESVTGRSLPSEIRPRRPGDPPRLVADPEKAGRTLGWSARRSLEEIVSDAWNWHNSPVRHEIAEG